MSFIDIKGTNCINCPSAMQDKLWPYFSKETPGVDVLFIGMSPSWEDEQAKVIFGGRASSVIRDFANMCDFSYGIAYVVQCRPVDENKKNRPVTHKEIKLCKPELTNTIALHAPKVIVLVGEAAAKYYLEGIVDKQIIKGKVNVGKMRGRVFDGSNNSKIVCIYNPAYYLRENGAGLSMLKEHYYADFTLIEKLALGTYQPTAANIVYVTDYKDVLNIVKMVQKHPGLVSVDFEVDTNENNPDKSSMYKRNTKLLTVGISIDGDTGYCIPLDHDESPFKGKSMPIHNMLTGKTLLSHNIMYELLCLDRFYNIDVSNIRFEDSLMLAYIINPDDKAGRDLKTLTSIYTPFGGYETDLQLFFDKLKPIEKDFGHIPMKLLAPYNAYDAICAYRVYHFLKKQAKEMDRLGLYEWLKCKIPMLSTMTHNGIMFNYPIHKQIKANLDTNIRKLHYLIMQHDYVKQAVSLCNDTDFNVKSTQHKQKLLFDVMRLSPIKKTPGGGPSADSDTMNHYKNEPVINAVLTEIKCRDMLSKYITPLDGYVCEDRFLHPLFNIAKTVTGRLSSNEPNIQVMPRNADIRDMLVAEPGFQLVSIDMSGAELRVLATIANEEIMIRAFLNEEDIHQQTADMVGVTRQDAKVVNFGIIYGMSARGLSAELNISQDDAQDIIDKYMEMYPGVKRYTTIIRDMVRKGAPIHTPFGRVRVFKYGRSEREYEEACRQAVNFPIQSIASDIMLNIGEKLCCKFGYRLDPMIGYSDPVLHGDKLYIIPHALIHDEIVVSTSDKWVDYYKAHGVHIAQTIELPFTMKVPIVAEAASGVTFGDIQRQHK